MYSTVIGRRDGLVVSVLNSGLRGSGLIPAQGHCIVFLGKTCFSHSALSTQVYN